MRRVLGAGAIRRVTACGGGGDEDKSTEWDRLVDGTTTVHTAGGAPLHGVRALWTQGMPPLKTKTVFESTARRAI
jgi:hypothetical protein